MGREHEPGKEEPKKKKKWEEEETETEGRMKANDIFKLRKHTYYISK